MEENRFEYFYRRYQNIRKIYSNGEVELAVPNSIASLQKYREKAAHSLTFLKNTRAPERMETNGFTSKERQRRLRSRSSE